MSPQSLTDDVHTEDVDPEAVDASTARAVGTDAGAAAGAEDNQTRVRLTVREMQIALAAARSMPHGVLDEPAGEVGADRGRTARCRAGGGVRRSPVVPPMAATSPAQSGTSPQDARSKSRPVTEAASASRARPEPWLPERDGPVSLAGVSAPRTRTVPKAAVTGDVAARRSAAQRSTTRTPGTAAIDSALAAAAAAGPPRLVVVAACGGAGATTATVLLAAALAPATGVLLLSGGADRGALNVRANAGGGDAAALAGWAAHHPGRPLQTSTPGLASGSVGTGRLVLAAAGRDDPGRPFDADTAAALLAAAASTRAAVLLDWSCPTPLPEHIRTHAAHVLVVAPVCPPGLLDAEYLVARLAAMPGRTSLSVLTVDVRGRGPRGAARASRARLQALGLPVTGLPFDPALAEDPRVNWTALRSRTRSAVVTALTRLLHPDPRPDPQGKDQS